MYFSAAAVNCHSQSSTDPCELVPYSFALLKIKLNFELLPLWLIIAKVLDFDLSCRYAALVRWKDIDRENLIFAFTPPSAFQYGGGLQTVADDWKSC
jgi:hypothetical protein